MQQKLSASDAESLKDFEKVSCEICGSEKHHLIASRTDLFLGGDRLFFMHECDQCGAIFQWLRPTPQKMPDYYPSDYQQYTKGLAEEKWLTRFSRRYGLRKRAKVVTDRLHTGKLLDVGCATGDFLSVAATFDGWTVFGIEPSHFPLIYAKEKVGLAVAEGVLNVAPFKDQSFDAITMWDVLEHVYNPRLVLNDVARLLKPGGLFVVNHPNVESIDRKIFGDMWLGYELPRHLFLFPGDLLSQLMAELGFVELERTCLYGSHAATFSSLMFLIEKRFKNSRVRWLARKLLFNVGTRLLLLPYFKLIDSLNRGSNITAVFKKQPNSENDKEKNNE